MQFTILLLDQNSVSCLWTQLSHFDSKGNGTDKQDLNLAIELESIFPTVLLAIRVMVLSDQEPFHNKCRHLRQLNHLNKQICVEHTSGCPNIHICISIHVEVSGYIHKSNMVSMWVMFEGRRLTPDIEG